MTEQVRLRFRIQRKEDRIRIQRNEDRRIRIQRNEDRISDLPDSLVEHILSFLPTKDAIATSILSKRWKPIWGSQRIYYVDDTTLPGTFAFLQLFNSFTIRGNTLPIPILSFHFKSRHPLHYNHDFVYAAFTRGIETLIIHLLHPIPLPPVILTTKSLSVLKLKRIKLNQDFASVNLPSLKVLHLETVTFKFEAYLHKLLYGTPILQELKSSDLKMEMATMMPPLGIAIPNLVRASLSGKSYIGLEWLHNVDHLHIHVTCWPPDIHGVFHTLTHLQLIFNFHDVYFKWSWLRKLLQNTPNLQTLIINELYQLDREPFDEWKDPEIVPECLLSHLTTCSLSNYFLDKSELRFAKYIMQNSRLLSTITIQSAKFLVSDAKLQMLTELSSCPRISPTSKLLFI